MVSRAGFTKSKYVIHSVATLLDLFFGGDKEELRVPAHLKSIYQSRSTKRLRNYASRCKELNANYLGQVYAVLKDFGALKDNENVLDTSEEGYKI